MTVVRIGTRGSKLALAQTGTVAEMLRQSNPGLQVETTIISTAGDRDQSSPLSAGEGIGWFTSALQDALLGATVDLAVHSYKDLPTKCPEGLTIAAIPLREDPRDALVSRRNVPLHWLPAGSVIGTSSARRSAQLRATRSDLELRQIRGNVDTRLAKLDAGEYDAIILAFAGLKRLGLEGHVSQLLGFEEMLPAPAQGALAVECRADDAETRRFIAAIDDPSLRQTVTAERTFLATLEAGCSFPAAAYAEHFGTTLKLHALVAAADGRIFRSKMAGQAQTAAVIGRALAEELMGLAELR